MDITIINLQTRIPLRLTRIKKNAQKALQYLGISAADLSIVFVSAQKMKRLNTRHLRHSYETDILTFNYAQADSDFLMAEIIICPSVARIQAKQYGVPLEKEIMLYVVHGILHVMGFDDHSVKDIKKIRSKEARVMEHLYPTNKTG